MVPKNLAIAGPESMAMWLTPAMTLWMKLTRPLLEFLTWVARKTLLRFGIEQRDELESTVDQEQLANMIQESREEGLLDAEETVRLAKALRQDSRQLKEAMIPLAQVTTIPYDPRGIRLSVIEQAVQDTGYSRFPVRIDASSLAGYVHVKDILDLMEFPQGDPRVSLKRIRPLTTVDAPSPWTTRSRCCTAVPRTWRRCTTTANSSAWSRWKTSSRNTWACLLYTSPSPRDRG